MSAPLSVVIPVGPDEDRCRRLAADLLLLPDGSEIIFSLCRPRSRFGPRPVLEALLSRRFRVLWVESPRGRAIQQNRGAAAASGEWLWFLHWDSGFGPELVAELERNGRQQPDALHFARLAFMPDGPSGMALNAAGANLRSRLLGLPFGDQGFFIRRALFWRLGGFDENASYGEDHLLVWMAHRRRIPLCCTRSRLLTSARKYAARGHLALTLRYQWLWLRQALPQLALRLAGR